MMEHVKKIFLVTGIPIDFEEIIIEPTEAGNKDLDYAIQSIKRNQVAIKGNVKYTVEKSEIYSNNFSMRR